MENYEKKLDEYFERVRRLTLFERIFLWSSFLGESFEAYSELREFANIKGNLIKNKKMTRKEKIQLVFKALKELSKKQNNLITVEDIVIYCKTLKIDAYEVEYSLEYLLRNGDIYEPKKNILSILK